MKVSATNAHVTVADGKANVTFKTPATGETEISGTITIFNKSGISKTLPWKKKIVIGK